ncbi:MFS transporter [Amorphus coralli]|uniref:MFS transporter n=1 Tax=Amorphus coralli TaxID=340680 RepID=UPI00037EA37C|nr:MFS transporter [Amorphus coralli]
MDQDTSIAGHEPVELETFPRWLTLLLATTCGLGAANIYYSQPLVGVISASLDMPTALAGFIVSLTQVGYGIGLFFVVPLADLLENRRLVVVLLLAAIAALLGASLSTAIAPFLVFALLIGVASVAVQVIVPYAAHLAPPHQQGRVVGDVMGGLMLGIMLSRPTASLITSAFSWHAVFLFSAILLSVLVVVLRLVLPTRRPEARLSYGRLIASMGGLILKTPALQRRSLYQACMFGAFTLFWTTVPLLLADRFGLTQVGIALFALAGVAGVIAAPLAGRLADRGLARQATAVMTLIGGLAVVMAYLGADGTTTGLVILVAAAVLLDFGMTGTMVMGQRVIFGLQPEVRARLNGIYMTAFFLSGAVSAALGAWTYAVGGWGLSMTVAGSLTLVAFAGLLILDGLGEAPKPARARASEA